MIVTMRMMLHCGRLCHDESPTFNHLQGLFGSGPNPSANRATTAPRARSRIGAARQDGSRASISFGGFVTPGYL